MNTPHTWANSPIHEQIRDAGLDPAEFARKLERELTAVTEQRDDYLTELQIVTERLKGNRHPDDNGIMADGEIDVKEIIEQRDEAREELAMWKSNHDNQVALKSMLIERPDLGDRASRIAELISERDRLQKIVDEQCRISSVCREYQRQRDRLIKAVEPLEYWRDISECDCSCPLPQGGCLRCDLNRILEIANDQIQP